MNITIKASIGGDAGLSGLGSGTQGLKGFSSGTSPLGSSIDSLNSTVGKLTTILTAMMFASLLSRGMGSGMNSGMGSGMNTGSDMGRGSGLKNTQSNSQDNAMGSSNLLSAPKSGTDALSQMLEKSLDDLLGHDTVTRLSNQTNSLANNLLNANQQTADNMNAFSGGMGNSLSSIMGNGLSQTSSGFSPMPLGNGGLQGLSSSSDFGQLGSALGMGVGQNAGLQALGNISTHKDGNNRHFVDKEDRSVAKEVGQLMDQYPEIFGKPEYQKDGWSSAKQDDKSWAKALSKPDDDGMTEASMNKFRQAVGVLKSAIAGDTGNSNLNLRGAGGASLGIDAAMVGDKITNMALNKLVA
ncbi:type III secretion protein HrpN [Prodigiosinella confusarubida]|uniref:Type III secretion protein HrpN n=1 Tax=Serratia sp. (strain ATCC 39006) TaxID=104623 RepID=A0A2I5TD77_SERS3|nr:type III secretion protein HrpN [Serratia sp. ATCC 39006]AUH02516.1 type III secretion protein HrpN [Serratia sp. ATCC 39006]AUH06832.1 type III secretion protein HrpN [Serratia sp. ATCC 39006]